MTPMQRRILCDMRNTGEDMVACTGHQSRTLGYGYNVHEAGGLVVRAYSDPLMWMERHGWIYRIQRNVPGRWYQLTREGCEIADKVNRG